MYYLTRFWSRKKNCAYVSLFDQLIEFIPYLWTIHFRFPFAFEIHVYKVMDLILNIMCQKIRTSLSLHVPLLFLKQVRVKPSKRDRERVNSDAVKKGGCEKLKIWRTEKSKSLTVWGPSEKSNARNMSLDQVPTKEQGRHLIVKEYNLVINRDTPERPTVAKQLEEKSKWIVMQLKGSWDLYWCTENQKSYIVRKKS